MYKVTANDTTDKKIASRESASFQLQISNANWIKTAHNKESQRKINMEI